MMTRRKTADPELIRLSDALAAEEETCERWYRRLARAFRALEKGRARGRRIAVRIRRREAMGNGSASASAPLPA